MMSAESKKKINNVIFERAFEIETILSDDDYMLAKFSGIPISNIEHVSLDLAIKELQKEFES